MLSTVPWLMRWTGRNVHLRMRFHYAAEKDMPFRPTKALPTSDIGRHVVGIGSSFLRLIGLLVERSYVLPRSICTLLNKFRRGDVIVEPVGVGLSEHTSKKRRMPGDEPVEPAFSLPGHH